MGAWVNFTNRIEIANKTWESCAMRGYGYKELTDKFIDQIVENPKIKYIQISVSLPDKAFVKIDRILSRRPDMTFRIYGLYSNVEFDLSCLRLLKHLQNLELSVDLKERQDMLDCRVLCDIPTLKVLDLDLFDLRDYSFVKGLSEELEELGIFSDTMNGTVNFDCEWLLRFQKLQKLYLGKKVKKHIVKIAELPELKDLTLRGIKLESFDFIRQKNLESLAVQWCGMNDLSSLNGFTSLKRLELWRIMKLEDISFISTLSSLESLRLLDLSHIHALPDLTGLENLKEIILDNVPIDETTLPERIRGIVSHH